MIAPVRWSGWAVWYSHDGGQLRAATCLHGSPADARADYERARLEGHRGTYGDGDQHRQIPDGAECRLVRQQGWSADEVRERWTHRAPTAKERAAHEAAKDAARKAEAERLRAELAGEIELY